MRTIVCSCDASFDAELPDAVDLDAQPEHKQAILAGTFMAVACPSCGRKLKPEIALRVTWPSRKADLYVVPESDRVEAAEVAAGALATDFVVGYPELADRVAVLEAGLDPAAVEILKYYLLLKAAEADPNAEASAWFNGLAADSLEFHVHGLRPGEVAVSRIPRSLYERTLAESKVRPGDEPFRSIRNGNYVSVQNLFSPEA